MNEPTYQDLERLVLRVISLFTLGICVLLARDCVTPAYAQHTAQDAAVADYSERDIAELFISNEMYRSVLVRMVLVRMIVSEADFNAVDHAAILHLIRRRAEFAGIPIESMARRYSASFKSKQTARLRWILALEPSCSEPDGWPKNLDWSDYEQRCLDTFARVDAFVRGELPDPCAGKADHFGGLMDHHRAQRARWRRVSCGKTANLYYKERGGVVDALKARGAR